MMFQDFLYREKGFIAEDRKNVFLFGSHFQKYLSLLGHFEIQLFFSNRKARVGFAQEQENFCCKTWNRPLFVRIIVCKNLSSLESQPHNLQISEQKLGGKGGDSITTSRPLPGSMLEPWPGSQWSLFLVATHYTPFPIECTIIRVITHLLDLHALTRFFYTLKNEFPA